MEKKFTAEVAESEEERRRQVTSFHFFFATCRVVQATPYGDEMLFFFVLDNRKGENWNWNGVNNGKALKVKVRLNVKL